MISDLLLHPCVCLTGKNTTIRSIIITQNLQMIDQQYCDTHHCGYVTLFIVIIIRSV